MEQPVTLEAPVSHAVEAALKGALALAQGLGPMESLSDPGERLELARRLDLEADTLERTASILQAVAMGLRIQAGVGAGLDPSELEQEEA
jgi:hypothetical protein